MFVLRQAVPEDVPKLYGLAQTVHFINLPRDESVILGNVERSQRAFAAALSGEPPLEDGSERFMFIMEDTEAGEIAGTSAIIPRMGGPGRPLVFLELGTRVYTSSDLGVTHELETIQTRYDASAPTEMGGLILSPAYRGHPAKLGKQLSLVRYNYIATHRDHFRDRVVAELMGAGLEQGDGNAFWRSFASKFIPLSYTEADKFSSTNREFMYSLLPHEPVHLDFLPEDARACIGAVGQGTKPARRMLEVLGFCWRGLVDPFDAGPVLETPMHAIAPIRKTVPAVLRVAAESPGSPARSAVLGADVDGKGFRAVECCCVLEQAAGGTHSVTVPRADAELLGVSPGHVVAVTPVAAGASKG